MSLHVLAPIQRPVRRWQRFKLNLPVCAVVARGIKTLMVRGTGKDISEGGMGIFAGVELSIDDKIHVEFAPAFGRPVRVHGIVRNRRGYTYGIEFLTGTPEEEQSVTQLKLYLFAAAQAEELSRRPPVSSRP